MALPAVAVLAVMAWSSGWGGGGHTSGLLFFLAVAVVNLAPFAAMTILVVRGGRAWPRGTPAAAVGVVALAALTAALLGSFIGSESSTAALLFLFMPAYLGLVVAAAAVFTGVLHRIRQRRACRNPPA